MIELFLFISLFFPRISLIIAWVFSGIPINNIPFFLDGIMTLLCPRLLIMYYILYAELGIGWLIIHIIALMIKIFINNSENN